MKTYYSETSSFSIKEDIKKYLIRRDIDVVDELDHEEDDKKDIMLHLMFQKIKNILLIM